MKVRSRVGIPAADFAPRNTNSYVVCVLRNSETTVVGDKKDGLE
jgi:hypothetical protein